ncbi:MAG TPA: glycosyltransferase family 1 protein [bacterium]|nr:glycosyltransferase family 1 protein [bacterium]HEX68654.1 glycosyltransferase family 1 protein [bacterium]
MGEDKMRILQVLGSKSPGGGSQEHTRFLSLGLCEKGHEVIVVTRPGKIVDWLRSEGLETIPVELRDRRRAIQALSSLIQDRRIEIVHTHNRDADIPGIISGVKMKVPLVVATIHAFLNRDKLGNPKMNFPLWKYNQLLRRRPHYIIALSEALKRQLLEEIRIPQEKVKVILNAVDLSRLKPLRHREDVIREVKGKGKLIVGGVGSLIRLKGYQYLIESASEIVKKIRNIMFILVGDGNYRKELEKLVEDKGLNRYFYFTGKVSHVTDYLQIMDIFVHPSLSEGLPRAVMEAMGMGIPVVATKVGGIPEVVVEDVTGILVSPASPRGLSKAILELLSSPEKRKRMGEEGRKRIYKNFNSQRMVDETEEFYLTAINDKIPDG